MITGKPNQANPLLAMSNKKEIDNITYAKGLGPSSSD